MKAKKEDIKEDAIFKTSEGRIGRAYAVTQKKVDQGLVDILFDGPGNFHTAPPSACMRIEFLELVSTPQTVSTSEPGTWTISDPDFEHFRIVSEGVTIAEVYRPIVINEDTAERYDIAEANARLIASAPELLEALRIMTKQISDAMPEIEQSKYHKNNPLWSTIRASKSLIQKAEGAK
jgi:hypothetical protein